MRVFPTRARAPVPPPEEWDGPLSGEILSVTIKAGRLQAAWVGGDQVYVIRDGAVLATGHDPVVVAKAPDVITNYVGAEHRATG
jgi:hypothetical protein